METTQWFIGKVVDRRTFYIAEHDNKESTTLWTPNRRESLAFLSDVACHKFISRYLGNRKDIILINVLTIK